MRRPEEQISNHHVHVTVCADSDRAEVGHRGAHDAGDVRPCRARVARQTPRVSDPSTPIPHVRVAPVAQ